MRRRRGWGWILLLLAAAFLAAFFLLGDGSFLLFAPPEGGPMMPPLDSLLAARCEYVTDGDTAWFLVREDGVALSHKVRFLNIDAPESYEEGGREAGDYVRAALRGKDVYLEYDSQRLDRYGRRLCHVWLKDGRLFNLELVRNGYAATLFIAPNHKYRAYFVAAEKLARNAGHQIWASPEPIPGNE